MEQMENQLIPLKQLRPHKRNYKQHPKKQIEQLKLSLQRFGQVRSVVAWEQENGSFIIVAGHGVYAAAKQLKFQSLKADILPASTQEAEIEAYLVADNELSKGSIDDSQMLAELLQAQQDLNFDLSGLGSSEEELQKLLSETASPDLLSEEDEIEPITKSAHLHFESSRAGGTFSMHLLSTWSEARLERFKAWKQEPDMQPAQTEIMASEIATALFSLFGGNIPSAVLTVPPRGKTAGTDKPYPAGVLAARVGALLGLDLIETVVRTSADTYADKSRSRWSNLRDESGFEAYRTIEGKLHIVLDDVTTTGKTLDRMREALKDVPTLLLVYIVWH